MKESDTSPAYKLQILPSTPYTLIYREHDKTVEIQQFDWEGTPIRKFIITNSIISFALDSKNKCIYGFKDNEDIYKYDISNYF